MTDDFKKNKSGNDIDSFFEQFDKISDDYKKSKSPQPKAPEGAPSNVSPDAFFDDKVVADRSKRLSKSKNAETSSEEALTDINDLFDDNDIFKDSFSQPEKKASPRPERNKVNNENRQNVRENGGRNNMARKNSSRPSSTSSRRKKAVKKKGKKRKHVWLKRFLAACGVMIVAGIVIVAFILQDTQKINWDDIYASLAESSVIYDDQGKKIDSIYSGEGSRVIVDYNDMPQNLTSAFVAIEDKTFWEHHGFNFIRMAGAVKDALFSSDRIGGTSTITQQLARNLWLAESKSERSLTRKIKEAYYAIQLERHLPKEKIIEAYLNTIALGQNSLGVQAASQAYFSKDVGELSLLECAALASLPQAPGRYSYIQTVAKGEVPKDDPRIIKQGKVNTYLYNDTAEGRVEMVLDFMEEQGRISSAEKEKAKVSKLRKKVKPNLEDQSEEAQFFVDYAIKNLTKDLMKEYNHTEREATQMVYSGGLKIYTTLNKDMQKSVEEQFKNNSNFPSVTGLNKDGNGNIKGKGGSIMLYKYSNYFDEKGNFILKNDEFKKQSNGDLLIKKGKRLNFYEVAGENGKEINIEFKDIYVQEDGIFYSINGGVINIPAQYKKFDSKGNVIIDAKFMSEKPEFMEVGDKIKIPNASYTLRQQVQQPQASMVILDHSNGQIKAMVGGRNIEGKMNFNRTTSPRQPGSSIKPIGAYGPAIEMGAEKQQIQSGEKSFGTYWTAASVIKDEEMKFQGKVWPKNWYSGYKGSKTLRYCVEQSINTTAVKVLNNIGTERSTDFLRKLGVTTIVDKGATNDMNPAALALGGMTKGISPLQMASAYGTFPNKGVHVTPTTYTVIKSKDDKLVLESKPNTTKAMDPGTAFIMTDILRTTVTKGIANSASIGGTPVAGKTGTTTDNFDAWFVGTTPKYAAALWIGNDVNIQLNEGSGAAARLWSRVMREAVKNDDGGSFPESPSNVSKKTVSGISEYFIDGTAPGSIEYSGGDTVTLCKKSNLLSTPWCPSTKEKTFSEVSGGSAAPSYYCNLHNLDTDQFPIDPKKKLDDSFEDPDKKKEEEEEVEPPVQEQPVQPTPETPETPTVPTSPTALRTSDSVTINPYDKLYSINRFYNNYILKNAYKYKRAS